MNQFVYHFEPVVGAKKTVFLLHGTGGNQYDLFPLIENIGTPIQKVGLLGNVVEHGMPRFFARYPDGTFDEESIKQETQKLADFLENWQLEHDLLVDDMIFIGYSNGANMIVALGQRFPHLVKKGALLHGLLPPGPRWKENDLQGADFFVSYGLNDRLIPPDKSKELVVSLQDSGADVFVLELPGGHEVFRDEIQSLREFVSAVVVK